MDHFCDHSIIRARVLVLRSTEIMVTMLHDMAGSMRAKETHDLLDEKNVDFFASQATEGGLGSLLT